MFPASELPRDPDGHQILVHESFFPDAIVTIVAVLSRMDRSDPERISEWRVYWHAFGAAHEGDPEARREITRQDGSKLPEPVARAIFPYVDGWYAR